MLWHLLEVTIQFSRSTTELTTAATDGLLGILAVIGLVLLSSCRDRDSWKVGVWSSVLITLVVVSILGTVVHGFDLSEAARELLWRPLYLLLGLLVALFVVAAVYDWLGRSTASRLLPMAVVVAALFFLLTQVVQGTFLVFVIYEATAMLLALIIYMYLAVRQHRDGAPLMALAIVLNIFAAAVQASGSISLAVIWQFDHNGVFHLVQMVAVVVLVLGLRRSLATSGMEPS
jgi:hypothetical protein